MDYKNITIKILLLLPILVIVVLLNFFIDPAGLYWNNYDYKIAKLLIEGKNVISFKSNSDERLFQKAYILSLKEKNNTIVLGSSRAMLIGKNLFNTNSFFNNSVSGASVEDILGIFYIYYERNFIPDTIIIGLDPWLFNKNNSQKRWKSISEYYIKMSNILNINNNNNDIDFNLKLFELFSFSYFQASFNMFIKSGFNFHPEPIPTNLTCDDIYTVKLSDGTICYNKKYRTTPQNEINNNAISVVGNSFYSLNNYYNLDEQTITILKLFIDYLKSLNIYIIFIMTPYHPLTYDALIQNEKYKIITECESWYIKYANENGIKILGSFNPNNLNLKDSDFYDFMHPKEKVYREIIKNNIYKNN